MEPHKTGLIDVGGIAIMLANVNGLTLGSRDRMYNLLSYYIFSKNCIFLISIYLMRFGNFFRSHFLFGVKSG